MKSKVQNKGIRAQCQHTDNRNLLFLDCCP